MNIPSFSNNSVPTDFWTCKFVAVNVQLNEPLLILKGRLLRSLFRQPFLNKFEYMQLKKTTSGSRGTTFPRTPGLVGSVPGVRLRARRASARREAQPLDLEVEILGTGIPRRGYNCPGYNYPNVPTSLPSRHLSFWSLIFQTPQFGQVMTCSLRVFNAAPF